MEKCIKCSAETCHYQTDLCLDHLKEFVAKTERGEFECCDNKEHDNTCYQGKCSKISCHLCYKECFKCNKEAKWHVVTFDKPVNVCDYHNPSAYDPWQEWIYYHDELEGGCMSYRPRVFNLKTKMMVDRK